MADRQEGQSKTAKSERGGGSADARAGAVVFGFALIYSIYLSPLNHHLFSKGAPLSWRVDMTKHNESCARVVVTLFASSSHGSRVMRSIAITRVFSQQQQWWMIFQSKISIKGFAKSIRHSRRMSSVVRKRFRWFCVWLVCLASFSFARVFYAFVVVVFFTSSFSGRRRFLEVAGSDRRTDRLILARPRVNWTSSTESDRQERRRIISLPSGLFLFLRSIVSWIMAEIDDAEVKLN